MEEDSGAELTSPTTRTELKRRDSIGERIEHSIAEHIIEDTAVDQDVGAAHEVDAQEDLNTRLQAIDALKVDVDEKLKLAATSSHNVVKVLLVISSLYKHEFISPEARSVLKDQAIAEVRNEDGILAAAVELFSMDGDMNECVDTFVQVSDMLLAKPLGQF
ncbi:hypothetical protein, variant [Aphanomyces astaci]|uniref:Uncharacterized protein n=1 Tax=Aphanomyces astaci TaxID=112090 RepID=W4GWI8_APHAT|nr:hypothetical protein, variant [Aphanomyces astaci]ETV84065.1 hypothetical protein, variant [Aphanomyces astaci]|eukprot:XP_009825757.1 hypothetical protein, variant [Aphanomyces astaci]